jgi:transcriptional regulator
MPIPLHMLTNKMVAAYLRDKGNSLSQIARVLKCSYQNVQSLLRAYKSEINDSDHIKNRESELEKVLAEIKENENKYTF